MRRVLYISFQDSSLFVLYGRTGNRVLTLFRGAEMCLEKVICGYQYWKLLEISCLISFHIAGA